jgi:Dolichyl-phosphate-mannose-protein mannosyltransferase
MNQTLPNPAPRLDALQRLYVGALRAADWLHARRLLVLLVGGPLLTLTLVAINQSVLLNFPNSGDEYVYLYQAETMAAGRLWNQAPPSPEIFATNYVIQEPGRVFGSFPPGWPLALALALMLHLPAWLLNPLLGTVTAGLLWALGTRLYSPRAGVLAAMLVLVSPFFLFNAASYFSHTFCGALLLGAAWLAARNDRAPVWVPLAIGALIGWAVLARYFTGVVCAIPIVLWLIRPGVARVRTLALVALGGLPWVVVLMAYNTALSGNPWTLTTTPLTVSLWFRDGFVLRGADILSTHLLRHLLWTPPVLIVAYVFYLSRGERELRRGALDWMPVLMVATLYFYVERGGNQYGPRFHYEIFLFLVVFVAGHLFRPGAPTLTGAHRVLFGLTVVSVALMPFSFAGHAVIEQHVIRERMDPFTRAAAANLPPSLVLIGGRVGTRRSMAALDLTRNGIDHTGRVLFGLDLGEDAHCSPAPHMPDRRTYLYVWDHARSVGLLVPLECP